MCPLDAWALTRLLAGESVNGELESVSQRFRALADHLVLLDPGARQVAFQGFLCGQKDFAAIVKSIAEIGPDTPPPETEVLEQCATLV